MWGISFSGGGQKGIAHIGVIKGIQEDKIMVTAVSGSSAGAIMAAALATNLSYTKLVKIAQSLDHQDVLDIRPNVWSIFKTYFRVLLGRFNFKETNQWSLLKGDKLTAILREAFGEMKISEVAVPLAVTAVDVNSGLDVVFTNRPDKFRYFDGIVISEIPLYIAVRSSISIPLVYKGIKYNDYYFVDGGLTNNTPVYLLNLLGAKSTISVEVTKRPPYEQSPEGIIDLGSRIISIAVDNSKYLVEPDIVVKPNLPEVTLGNTNKNKEMIELGYESYVEKREKIIEKNINFF